MALRVLGLFAGIGGIELGLDRAGHESVLLCDVDESAQAVLAARFGGVPLVGDVREIVIPPAADVLAAGFPCQDLSQAGRTAGIDGQQSGLVREVFRLASRSNAKWLLLENVPFMLQLERGRAMKFLTDSLDDLGFNWAYRVVDARAFGLPQRRQRVVLVASRTEDPREVLFSQDEGEPDAAHDIAEVACGFYWTEGVRGLGWAVDAIPTLKGGSSIGIPSPPAIRFPGGFIGTPDLRDAERLQGFDADWTAPAEEAGHKRARWKLIGNAVSVPLAGWLGQQLAQPGSFDETLESPLTSRPWPKAACGMNGRTRRVDISAWPVRAPYQSLMTFLQYDAPPLSKRAAEGFLGRARESSLNFPTGLLDDVAAHIEFMTDGAAAAAA